VTSPARAAAQDFSLLPKDRTFRDLLPAFLLPYLAYVAVPGLLSGIIGPDLAQAVRFLAVGGLLLFFRGNYAFGPRLTAARAGIAVAAAIVATLAWIVSLRLLLELPFWRDRLAAAQGTDFSLLYAVLRTMNSVLLVPLFEELFCRVWVQELAHPSPDGGTGGGKPGLLDRFPRPLRAPPLSARAVLVAAAVFALGHDAPSVLPAILYFLITTAAYAYTRSFRAVILVHALANLGVAAAAWSRPDFRFLWF
jgi:hypothetical protein